ncbi:MAG: hypothetical protein AB7T49_07315 [Oligoflexales bacterium]
MKHLIVIATSLLVFACQQGGVRVVESQSEDEKTDNNVAGKSQSSLPVNIDPILEKTGDPTQTPDLGTSATTKTLTGTFATACTFASDQPGSLDEYHQLYWVFRDDGVAGSIQVIAEGNNCDAGALMVITTLNAYAIGDAISDFPDAFVSGFQPVQILVRPANEDVVAELEDADAYGIKDWKVGVDHDVTSFVQPNGGATTFNMLKIEPQGRSVQFGAGSSSAQSIERRLLPEIFNRVSN